MGMRDINVWGDINDGKQYIGEEGADDGEEMVGAFDVRRYGLDSELEVGINKCRDLLSSGS